jgi:hypothetical protein
MHGYMAKASIAVRNIVPQMKVQSAMLKGALVPPPEATPHPRDVAWIGLLLEEDPFLAPNQRRFYPHSIPKDRSPYRAR